MIPVSQQVYGMIGKRCAGLCVAHVPLPGGDALRLGRLVSLKARTLTQGGGSSHTPSPGRLFCRPLVVTGALLGEAWPSGGGFLGMPLPEAAGLLPPSSE